MPSSRLQDACRDELRQELKSIREFRRRGGRTLGYVCSGFPAALAAGLGFRPIRIMHGIDASIEDAGGKLVRPDVCPLIKALAGGVVSGLEPFSLVDVWMGLSTCDQTRRCFSLLHESVPVFAVQLPSTRTREAADYYALQMEDFAEHSERITGEGFSTERALEHLQGRISAGRILREAALSGRLSPLDLHWLFHLYHLADPENLTGTLRRLIDMAEDYEPACIIGLTGSSMVMEDLHTLEALQRRNAGVIPLGCTGLQALEPEDMEISDPSPGNLARMSFEALKCPRSRPNSSTFAYLEESIRSCSCAGLIVKTLKFCDLWYTERERFRSRMPVPVLVMDTDYGQGEALRQANRIDSFLDTLEVT